MAVYTVTLREIANSLLKQTPRSDNLDSVEAGIDVLCAKLMPNYPIFDEDYRESLNKKIMNHFYFREIGLETPALFRFHLTRHMEEVMPYFNELYKAMEWVKDDPLINMDYTVNHDGSSKDTLDNTRNGTDNLTTTDTLNRTTTDDTTTTTDMHHDIDESGDTVTQYNSQDTSTQTGSVEHKKGETHTVVSVTDGEEKTNQQKDTYQKAGHKETWSGNDTNDKRGKEKTHRDSTQKFNDTPQTSVSFPLAAGYITTLTNDDGDETLTFENRQDQTTYNHSVTTVAVGEGDHTIETFSGSPDTSHSQTDSTDTASGSDEDIYKNKTDELTKRGFDTIQHGKRVDSDDNGTVKVDHDGTLNDTRNGTNNRTTSNTVNENRTNANEYLDKYHGLNGVLKSEAIKKYMDTVTNVDMMLFESLEPLFMQIF